MRICPLCNGLAKQKIVCPVCKEEMIDGGSLENYYEPYSPYLPKKILDQTDEVGQNACLHLLYCPHCGYDCRYLSTLIPTPQLI
jgi:hypothetical protein